MKDLQLLQTISSRLCHDLAGSIGVINNCVELMDNDNKSIRKRARDLLSEESRNLVQKLKFSRFIYGASEDELEIDVLYIDRMLKACFFGNNNIDINSHFAKEITYVHNTIAKICMSLIVLATENIRSGSSIELFWNKAEKSSDHYAIKIVVTTHKNASIEILGKLSDLKDNDDTNINIDNCREHYVSILCHNNGYMLDMSKKDDITEYNITYKSK